RGACRQAGDYRADQGRPRRQEAAIKVDQGAGKGKQRPCLRHFGAAGRRARAAARRDHRAPWHGRGARRSGPGRGLVASMRLAVTGGTGFVGSHLLDQALGAGHEVATLTRREQPGREGIVWVAGDLHDRAALERLMSDADAVIHVAGVITGQTAAAFDKGNVEGTLSMLAAATAGGVRRFVHVSSLAAREPNLSLYGDSKARSEQLVMGSGLDWAVVRPPAVYGPGDKETLELFRMA